MDDATTRLVLIRHGESASNAGGWLSGQETCGGLTATGIAQAEALRWRLAADQDLVPDVVLVSTMRRAVETAEIIATPTGLVPEQRAELMERTPGEAEGLTSAQYTEQYGRAPWSNWAEPISPGGESGDDFTQRVLTATDRAVADHRGKTVWVVCHGGVIMVSAMQRWPGASAVDEAWLPAHGAGEHLDQRMGRRRERRLATLALQRPHPPSGTARQPPRGRAPADLAATRSHAFFHVGRAAVGMVMRSRSSASARSRLRWSRISRFADHRPRCPASWQRPVRRGAR